MASEKEFEAKFTKSGFYYFGDICYAMDDDLYQEIWGVKHCYADGCFEIPSFGESFAVGGTAYGDGNYIGTDGKTYGVDAGVIGIVPESMWEKGCSPDDLKREGTVIKLYEGDSLDFHSKGGVFTLSINRFDKGKSTRIVVDTLNEDEDEDDDDYWPDLSMDEDEDDDY